MRRRNFILGGGLLASLSLGATATNASLADSVPAAADFRAFVEQIDASADITLGNNTQFTETTHTWDNMQFTSDGLAITRIEADYGDAGDFADGGGFDSLDQGDVTVQFWTSERGGRLSERAYDSFTNSDAATATFEIDEDEDEAIIEDSGDEEDTNVFIELSGFENPESGSYEPTLTFEREDGEELTVGEASFSTSTGDGNFQVTITNNTPEEVTVDSEFSVEAEIENTGAGEDSQTITLEIVNKGEDGNEDTKSVDSLGVGETETVTLDSDGVAETGEIEVVVSSEDESENTTIDVVPGAGWGINLESSIEDDTTKHTWDTSEIDYDGAIDEITINYIDGVQGPRLDMDDVDEFTIELTLDEDDDEPTNIEFTEDVPPNDQGEVTFDLDDDPTPEINGTSRVIIDGVRNPNDPGEYEAEITLTGDDNYSETVTYELEE